jgi:hypothetical protein
VKTGAQSMFWIPTFVGMTELAVSAGVASFRFHRIIINFPFLPSTDDSTLQK